MLLGGAFALLLICAAAFWLVMPALLDPCANDNTEEFPSPDGRMKSVRFRRNCGATTGHSTHVSLLPAARKLGNEAGNVFVIGDEPPVAVRWIDALHVKISAPRSASASFLHLSELDGISIAYD